MCDHSFYKKKYIPLYFFSLWLSFSPQVHAGWLDYFFPITRKTIVMQYVDYDCNPIAGETFLVEDYKLNFMSGSSVYYSEVTTDKNGYAEFQRKYNGSLEIMNKKHWENPWHGHRNRSYVRDLTQNHLDKTAEIQAAIASTQKNPLVIYPYEAYPFNERRQYSKVEHKLFDYRSENNAKTQYAISGSAGSDQHVVNLAITRKNGSYTVDVYGQRGGGIIEVQKHDLPFSETIPVDGYQRHLAFAIPTSMTFPNQHQVNYYFKSTMGNGFGTLTLSFTIIDDSLVVNSFVDAVFSDRRYKIKPPVIFLQENCGGVAARNYSGYFGNISPLSRLVKEIPVQTEKRLKLEHPDRKREAVTRRLLEDKARDLSTPDSWFTQLDPNPYIASVAIDNNAPISSRLKILFDVHKLGRLDSKGRHHHHKGLMRKLATDLRTPPDVLSEIYDMDVSDRVNWSIMAHPKTPTLIADEILHVLTQKILASQQDKTDLVRLFNDYVFGNTSKPFNSISKNALNDSVQKLSSVLVSRRLLDLYGDERITPKSLSIIWASKKARNNAKFNIDLSQYPLLKNKNTPLSVLLDIYEYLKDRSGQDNYKALITLLNHPAIPQEIFYELQKANQDNRWYYVLASSERTPPEILRALVNSNVFDSVKKRVALNPNTPHDLLLKLSSGFGYAVIKNPALSVQELSDLYDGFTKIQQRNAKSLLKAPKTPSSVIRTIYNNNWVQRNHYDYAKHPNTPSDVLRKMYGISNGLDEKIAGHPNIAEDLVLEMIDDAQARDITHAIAKNPVTPESILWRLFKGDFIVTDSALNWKRLNLALYCNTGTPNELRYQLPYMLHLSCKGR